MFPALRIAFGRWHKFSGQMRAYALLAQEPEDGEEERERLRVRAYRYLDSNSQLFTENQYLRDALAFYAAHENWQSSSTDIERRYNSRPSAIDLDWGRKARAALDEPMAADTGGVG